MELATLFDLLWGQREGFASLAYTSSVGKPRDKYYSWPDQKDVILEDIENLNEWTDVFFCPHLLVSPKRNKENADLVPALWVDKDKGKMTDLEPEPSIIWETSPNKWQALWLLSEPINPLDAEQYNKALDAQVGGDKQWYLGKLLRVPGTVNYKKEYEYPLQGKLIQAKKDLVYTTQQLDSLIQKRETASPLGEEVRLTLQAGDMPDEFPSKEEILMRYGPHIPPRAWKFLQEKPAPGDDWSEGLWALEHALLEAGLTPREAFPLVETSPWNKYYRDGRPREDLWKELNKAYYSTMEKRKSGNGHLPWVGMNKILSSYERPTWLVEEVWMDKNVGWIAGVGKSFKSTLGLDLALSVASGRPFLDTFSVLNPGPVMVIEEEDPPWRVYNRMRAIARAKGLSYVGAELGEHYLRIWEKPQDVPIYVLCGAGFNFADREMVETVEKDIDDIRPRMVMLDPWFMLTPGMDENKSSEMTKVLNLLKQWRDSYGCAIPIIHHYRKSGGDGQERLYGSMALYAWSENSLFVERKKDRVVVSRDIKDAENIKPFAVKFSDIDDTYEFVLGKADDMLQEEQKTIDGVARALMQFGTSSNVTLEELSSATGRSEKSVSKAVKQLEEQELAEMVRAGKGGAVFVQAKDALWDLEEGVSLLDDAD